MSEGRQSEQAANKEICKKFFTHIGAREYDDALALVADDMVWWVQGDTPGSGYRHQKETLTRRLKAGMDTKLEITFGYATAEEDRVALEMKSKGKLKNGKDYANTYHFLIFLKDGLIRRGHEYFDTKHATETVYWTPPE